MRGERQFGFNIQGLGFRVWGLGLRISARFLRGLGTMRAKQPSRRVGGSKE